MLGQKTGGRQKGVPNKNNRDIKELARKHGAACIEGLAALMGHDEPEVRIKAMNSLLDRGYGKPSQPHVGDDTAPPIRQAIELTIIDAKG